MVEEWYKTRSITKASEVCDTIHGVMEWGRSKNLDDPKAQLNKVIEEVGEIAHEISRNNYSSDELKDAIGDTLVTVVILSDILGYDPISCLKLAYDEISNRTGQTKNGTFVKD